MEKLSDDRLREFIKMMEGVPEEIGTQWFDLATDLLSTRAELAAWEEKEKYRAEQVKRVTGTTCLDIVLNDYAGMKSELAALQDKVRWVPVGESLPEPLEWVYPFPELNAGRATWYDHISHKWECSAEVTPTHWRKRLSSPIPTEGE